MLKYQLTLSKEFVKDEEITRRSKKELTMKLIKYLKLYKFKALIIIILMIFVVKKQNYI